MIQTARRMPDDGGDQQKKTQPFIDIAHFAVLLGTHHGLAEFMGNIAGHGHHPIDPHVHHARRHKKSPAAADETAQHPPDKSQDHHLDNGGKIQGNE